jgi:hypothetical protein
MKKVLFLAIFASLIFSFISCSRGITPYEAANGKAKCGRYVR